MTDYGVIYRAGFSLTDVLACTEIHEFVIINVNRKRSPRDPKLKDTIIAIVTDFFKSSETAMLYICDTGDGRQAMRNRLFRYWTGDNPDSRYLAIVSGTVVDEEGVRNYATLIIRLDHPMRDEAIREFNETVRLLNEKPSI